MTTEESIEIILCGVCNNAQSETGMISLCPHVQIHRKCITPHAKARCNECKGTHVSYKPDRFGNDYAMCFLSDFETHMYGVCMCATIIIFIVCIYVFLS